MRKPNPVEIRSVIHKENRSVRNSLAEIFPVEVRDQVANRLPDQAGLIVFAKTGQKVLGAACVEFVPGRLAVIHLADFGETAVRKSLFCEVDRRLHDNPSQVAQVSFGAGNRIPDRWLEDRGYRIAAHVQARVWVVNSRFRGQHECPSFLQVDLGNPDDLERVFMESLVETRDCQSYRDPRAFQDIVETYQYESENRREGWFYVVVDKKTIGCVLLAAGQSSVEILYFGIVPRERRKGYGQKIVEFAKNWSRQRESDFVLAYVDRSNLPAVKLYDRQNFLVSESRTLFAKSFPP